jgi:two-component system sensor histidine kinase HydH
MVEGTAAEWERVFMNLFLNSVQAMPDGGRIDVRARQDASAVRILVSDNGSGIPTDLIGDIFRPAVSGKASHHGLGLHIVSSIVASHNGSVAAANRAAGGAEFSITVPAA